MNPIKLKFGAWAGVLTTVFLGVALIAAARFFPPLSPASGAEEIGAIFRDGDNGIRLASILLLFGAASFAVFTATLSSVIRYLENDEVPMLSYLQLICGVVTTMLFMSMAVLWSVAAFRLERSNDLILVLNDMAWVWFLFTATLPAMQVAALGLAILGENRPTKTFSPLMGWASLCIGSSFLTGIFIPFFKTGPFAWDGLLAFWLPLTTFLLWFYVMAVQLIALANRMAAKAS